MEKYIWRVASVCALATAGMVMGGCRDTSRFDDEPPMPVVEQPGGDVVEEPSAGNYDEQYRPQIHYTPARNWVNDPNGLVYADGTYHMFYQYNPSGNVWGNMSWGHAVSADLVHWQEKPVALTGDELGAIFSGSAVVDRNNTAGFGKDAIVALYTSADIFQQQSLAYSVDGGETFTKYADNPVIANSNAEFRDPKVFWHEESGQWIMALALGWNYGVEFQGSTDLKHWSKLSEFKCPVERCNKGQWECPDLLRMEYQGAEKWVLLVSVNPGGPAGGSGTMYFTGDFDGTTFTADSREYPLWVDYGSDNYAGVTWSGLPDGRQVMIGWMNNWNYAGDVPCNPWRSAFTLPRELKLIESEGGLLLASTVVAEVDDIAGEWVEAAPGKLPASDAYHLKVTAPREGNTSFSLANSGGERVVFSVNGSAGKLLVSRNAATGATGFNGRFSIPAVSSPLNTSGETVVLDIYVDRSSVEVFTEDGSMCQTNLVFPGSIYDTLECGQDVHASVRPLSRIW